jgi:NTP pyrophosphatase (non-canonical NTP hydrolase)
MKIKKRIQRLKDLANVKMKVHDPLLALVEEVGEVAQAINVEDHGKGKTLKEDSAEECVDVILCALELFYSRGGDDELLIRKMDEKLDKWENRLNDKFNEIRASGM